jgi:hypothetical protein
MTEDGRPEGKRERGKEGKSLSGDWSGIAFSAKSEVEGEDGASRKDAPVKWKKNFTGQAKARREREVGRQKSEVRGERRLEVEKMRRLAGIEHRVRFREDGIRKFQALFRRSLDIRPEKWKMAVDRVQEYFPGDAVALGIVPDTDEKLKSMVLRYIVGGKKGETR